MKIALIGYGKMGQTIEALGMDQGHQFPLIIDVDNGKDLIPEKSKQGGCGHRIYHSLLSAR